MNKKLTAALLAAALCLVSCGSKADESSEAAGTAETTTVTTTVTTTATTTTTNAAETTTKKTKKKKTTTAKEEAPAEDAAVTLSVEEAIEAAKSDPEFKQLTEGYKALVKKLDKPWSSSTIPVVEYAGIGFNFWTNSELWTAVQDTQQAVQLKREDELRDCDLLILRSPVKDIPNDDIDGAIYYISSSIMEQISGQNAVIMGESTYQTTYGGNNAVRKEYAVADKGSSYPVSIFGIAGFIGNGKLYVISYAYPAYMPYEDTGFDDVFNTFQIADI